MGQAKLFCVKIVPKDFFKAQHRSTTKQTFLPWSTAPTEIQFGNFERCDWKKYTFCKSATFFFWVQNFHVEFKIVFVSLLSYIHILEQLFSSYPKIANIVPYFRNDWAITRSKKIEVNGAGILKYKLMGDQWNSKKT